MSRKKKQVAAAAVLSTKRELEDPNWEQEETTGDAYLLGSQRTERGFSLQAFNARCCQLSHACFIGSWSRGSKEYSYAPFTISFAI